MSGSRSSGHARLSIISSRSPCQAAERFASLIKSKVGRLGSFPESGRVVPEFPSSGLREIIVKDYRAIYRYRKQHKAVEILTVWHGARLLETQPRGDR